MFSTLRNRFGIPGVISVIALVFALIGGAFAANDLGSSGKSATASAKKSSKGPRGPRGPRGPKGATGAQGAAGSQGSAGTNGKDGANGSDGAPGAPGADGSDGSSVTSEQIFITEECGQLEGVRFHSASGESHVCDGEKGPKGAPWTAGGTLPSGETLTGAWAFGESVVEVKLPSEEIVRAAPSSATVPLSFPIPLENGLGASHVHFINSSGMEVIVNETTFTPEEVTPTACGSAIGPEVDAGNPQAEPGELCVYAQHLSNASMFTNFGGIGPLDATTVVASGASTAGAVLRFTFLKAVGGGTSGWGSWAVTAP